MVSGHRYVIVGPLAVSKDLYENGLVIRDQNKFVYRFDLEMGHILLLLFSGFMAIGFIFIKYMYGH